MPPRYANIQMSLTGSHEVLGLLSEGSALLDGVSEHVSGGEVAQAPLVADDGRLGSLAGTGGTDKDEASLGLLLA